MLLKPVASTTVEIKANNIDDEHKIHYNVNKRGQFMANVNVNIRMDSDLKKQFEAFCNDMGMSMTTAFTVFAKKAVREYRIPFEIGAENPNIETLEAMREAERMKTDPLLGKSYETAGEMIQDLTSDV